MVASDLKLLQFTQEIAIAILAVVIWDWLVCLAQEWKVVWKTKWSLINVLYLISRYWSLGCLSFGVWSATTVMDHEACVKVVHWIPATCAVITLSTEAILAVRTYALWGRPRWLLAVITFCMLFELACLILGSVLIAPVFPPGVPGPCVPTSTNAGNYLYFLSPFFVDCIFTALCFFRAAKINKIGGAGNVLKIFIRDGFIYFCVVSLANVVQTGFFIQPVSAMKVINALPALGLSSMMCCRLVLSLKSMDSHTARYEETELSARGSNNVSIGGGVLPIIAKTERVTVTDVGNRSHTPSAFLTRPNETVVDIEGALNRKASSADTFMEKDMVDEKSSQAL